MHGTSAARFASMFSSAAARAILGALVLVGGVVGGADGAVVVHPASPSSFSAAAAAAAVAVGGRETSSSAGQDQEKHRLPPALEPGWNPSFERIVSLVLELREAKWEALKEDHDTWRKFDTTVNGAIQSALEHDKSFHPGVPAVYNRKLGSRRVGVLVQWTMADEDDAQRLRQQLKESETVFCQTVREHLSHSELADIFVGAISARFRGPPTVTNAPPGGAAGAAALLQRQGVVAAPRKAGPGGAAAVADRRPLMRAERSSLLFLSGANAGDIAGHGKTKGAALASKTVGHGKAKGAALASKAAAHHHDIHPRNVTLTLFVHGISPISLTESSLAMEHFDDAVHGSLTSNLEHRDPTFNQGKPHKIDRPEGDGVGVMVRWTVDDEEDAGRLRQELLDLKENICNMIVDKLKTWEDLTHSRHIVVKFEGHPRISDPRVGIIPKEESGHHHSIALHGPEGKKHGALVSENSSAKATPTASSASALQGKHSAHVSKSSAVKATPMASSASALQVGSKEVGSSSMASYSSQESKGQHEQEIHGHSVVLAMDLHNVNWQALTSDQHLWSEFDGVVQDSIDAVLTAEEPTFHPGNPKSLNAELVEDTVGMMVNWQVATPEGAELLLAQLRNSEHLITQEVAHRINDDGQFEHVLTGHLAATYRGPPKLEDDKSHEASNPVFPQHLVPF